MALVINGSICLEVWNITINSTQIKYSDLVLLIPSSLFLMFLLIYCKIIYRNHVSLNSSIITTFYVLLLLASGVKIIRAIVGIAVNHEVLDRALWLVTRFFLLSTEMSIITFGVAAAKLDSRSGVRRVILVTSLISLTYTTVQAVLEFKLRDRAFMYNSDSIIFEHGGCIFIFVTSLLFFMLYVTILFLPICCSSRNLRLPTKKVFYAYCAILAVKYFVEAVSSMFLLKGYKYALCSIDITTILYCILYDPLVYVTFLLSYFRRRRILNFRYNQQLEYADQSIDAYKHFDSSSRNASSVNYSPRDGKMPNSFHGIDNSRSNIIYKEDDDDGDNYKDPEDSTVDSRTPKYYPDRCIVLDNVASGNEKGDFGEGSELNHPQNVIEMMRDFHILPEGARMDLYPTNTRYPSSTVGSDTTAGDEYVSDYRNRVNTNNDNDRISDIISLSEERY